MHNLCSQGLFNKRVILAVYGTHAVINVDGFSVFIYLLDHTLPRIQTTLQSILQASVFCYTIPSTNTANCNLFRARWIACSVYEIRLLSRAIRAGKRTRDTFRGHIIRLSRSFCLPFFGTTFENENTARVNAEKVWRMWWCFVFIGFCGIFTTKIKNTITHYRLV